MKKKYREGVKESEDMIANDTVKWAEVTEETRIALEKELKRKAKEVIKLHELLAEWM